MHGHGDVVRALVEKKAKMSAKDKLGQASVGLAPARDHEAMVWYFSERKYRDVPHNSPEKMRGVVFKPLRDMGPDINASLEDSRRKAMRGATEAGSAERMKLSLGDDTNVHVSGGSVVNTVIQSVLYATVAEMTPRDRGNGTLRIDDSIDDDSEDDSENESEYKHRRKHRRKTRSTHQRRQRRR
ncbi:hypothetical protein NW759_015544 [Fusarium solani]|nr:hypothetical protein NW759_015544 [Fusarium solani]